MALSDLDLIMVALFLPRLKNRVCKVVRTSQLSNINETTQILLEEMYLITKSYAFNQLRRDAMMLELKRAQVALVISSPRNWEKIRTLCQMLRAKIPPSLSIEKQAWKKFFVAVALRALHEKLKNGVWRKDITTSRRHFKTTDRDIKQALLQIKATENIQPEQFAETQTVMASLWQTSSFYEDDMDISFASFAKDFVSRSN